MACVCCLILQISRQLLESVCPAGACSLLQTNLAITVPPFPFFHFSFIPGGDDDMDFDIEKSTGSMVIARALDARKKSSYNLTVEVTDGSTTIKTQVMLYAVVENPYRKPIESGYAKGNLSSAFKCFSRLHCFQAYP